MQRIEQWLESDDEFPENCYERVLIPAYLNDNRFKQTNKDIIDENKSENEEKFPKLDVLEENEIIEFSMPKRLNIKGVLRRKDIVCLKCIEKHVDEDFFLWFLNFLMLKDLQRHLTFLKSCLVNQLCDNRLEEKIVNERDNINQEQSQRYRFIVK